MSRKIYLLLIVVLALFSAFGGVWTAAAAATETDNKILNSDCIKCHQQEVRDVEANGAQHLTAVTCLDCHLEHPPGGSNAIPLCSQCHDPETKTHYKVENCVSCHYPHYPLQIDIADGGTAINPVCLSCHNQQGEEMKSYPSLHSELACAECHPKHATYQECLACHEPHSTTMAYQDCLRCHKPHMPTLVKYDDDIPSDYCGSCHEKELGMLATNQTKHHDLLCVYCHKSQHKLVPECVTCHGEPHGSSMHKKFPDCLACHVDAHALAK